MYSKCSHKNPRDDLCLLFASLILYWTFEDPKRIVSIFYKHVAISSVKLKVKRVNWKVTRFICV